MKKKIKLDPADRAVAKHLKQLWAERDAKEAQSSRRNKAIETVLTLNKKALRWYDQFMGHGHWKFVLEAEDFNKLFEALKATEIEQKKGKPNAKRRRNRSR
jgi:hypothetical protein